MSRKLKRLNIGAAHAAALKPYLMLEGETRAVQTDFNAYCSIKGTSVSSVDWTATDGVTLASEAVASDVCSVLVTAVDIGTFPMTCVATLANGEKLNRTWRVQILPAGGEYVPATPLACPILLSPADGEITSPDDNGYLSFTFVPNATSYGVYVWADGDPMPDEPVYTTTTSPYIVPGLDIDQTYNWYVTAFLNGVESTGCAGASRSFTTSPPIPECPSLTSPANGATLDDLNEVTLEWSASTYADTYKVYVWAVGEEEPLIPLVSQAGLTYLVTGLDDSTSYNWKVIAENENGESSGCGSRSFTTAEPEIDPYADDVWSYLRFNETAGSTTFIDEIPARNWIQIGFVVSSPDPVIAVEGEGLYGNCGKGRNTDYFEDNGGIRHGNSPAFFAVGNTFCWEASVKCESFTRGSGFLDQCIFAVFGNGAVAFSLEVTTTGSIILRNVNGTILTSNDVLSLDTWHSVCLERPTGNVLVLYIDGVAQAQTFTITPTNDISLVQYWNWNGSEGGRMFLDECRITERFRYNGNYTPRLAEFPDPTP